MLVLFLFCDGNFVRLGLRGRGIVSGDLIAGLSRGGTFGHLSRRSLRLLPIALRILRRSGRRGIICHRLERIDKLLIDPEVASLLGGLILKYSLYCPTIWTSSPSWDGSHRRDVLLIWLSLAAGMQAIVSCLARPMVPSPRRLMNDLGT